MHTLPEIQQGLENSFAEIAQSILKGKEIFQSRPGEKWSIAEQLDHLVRSNLAVANGLKLPLTEIAKFGTPIQPARDFATLHDHYKAGLANGFRATARFVPEIDADKEVEKAVEEWTKIGQQFQLSILAWEEANVDKYVLPHPALGLLSIREMLFFTVFHNQHHLEKIEGIKIQFNGQ